MHILEVIKHLIHLLLICLRILQVSTEKLLIIIPLNTNIQNGISNVINIALIACFAIWNTDSTTGLLPLIMIMVMDKIVIPLILHRRTCRPPTACILARINLRVQLTCITLA